MGKVDVTFLDRDFEKLHPELRRRLLVFLDACGRRKLAVFMTEGWRHAQRQTWLWESGRGRKGPILTYAKAGQSFHNLMRDGKPCSAAVDIAIWDEDQPWAKSLEWAGDAREWAIVAEAAKIAGLRTLSFEKPHLELPYALQELEAGLI